MAWLEPHPTSGQINICLRWQGKKIRRTLKTAVKKEAQGILHRFEENIVLLERGRLVLPDGGDLMTFLLSGGRLTGIKPAEPKEAATLTLAELVKQYLATSAPITISSTMMRCTVICSRR